jgi:hypothetical protein
VAIILKKVMFLKLADDGSIKQHKQLNNLQSPKKKAKSDKKESLSEQDLKELMGIDRPTYKRVRGAIRNK